MKSVVSLLVNFEKEEPLELKLKCLFYILSYYSIAFYSFEQRIVGGSQ